MTVIFLTNFFVFLEERGAARPPEHFIASYHFVRCNQLIVFFSHIKPAPVSQQYFFLTINQHQPRPAEQSSGETFTKAWGFYIQMYKFPTQHIETRTWTEKKTSLGTEEIG